MKTIAITLPHFSQTKPQPSTACLRTVLTCCIFASPTHKQTSADYCLRLWTSDGCNVSSYTIILNCARSFSCTASTSTAATIPFQPTITAVCRAHATH